MSVAKYADLRALKRALERDVAKVMQTKVAKVVMEAQQAAIQETVYGAYSPKEYIRRGEGGGLASASNIQNTGSGLTVVVQNFTQPSEQGNTPDNPNPWGEFTTTDKDLPATVEFGGGYDYTHGGGGFMEPRPFVEATVERLASTKQHLFTLAEGLSAMGYQVR